MTCVTTTRFLHRSAVPILRSCGCNRNIQRRLAWTLNTNYYNSCRNLSIDTLFAKNWSSTFVGTEGYRIQQVRKGTRRYSDFKLKENTEEHPLPATVSISTTGNFEIRARNLSLTNGPLYIYLKGRTDYKKLFFQHDEFSHLMSEDGNLTHLGEETVNSSVKNFIELCSSNLMEPITDPKHQETLSNLRNHCPMMSDTEIVLVLYNIRRILHRPVKHEGDFRKIWEPLDERIMLRYREKAWSFEFIFGLLDLLYAADLARDTELNWQVVKALYRRMDELSKEEFVVMMFCWGSVKRIPAVALAIHNVEFNFLKFVDAMKAEEVAVVAAGFNKKKIFVKNHELIAKIMRILCHESEISARAITVVARSIKPHVPVSGEVYTFLETFTKEIPRLPFRACSSLLLMGERAKVEHEQLLLEVVKKVRGNVHSMTITDIENIVEGLSMFNVDCEDLYEEIVENFRNKIKNASTPMSLFCTTKGRSFLNLLHSLSLKGIYPEDLISLALSTDFISLVYGRSGTMYTCGPEALQLDISIEIEARNYSGPRLPEKWRRLITKKHMLWIANEGRDRMTPYQMSARNMFQVCSRILGESQYAHLCNVIPPFKSIGVVYCTDESTRRPVPVPDSFVQLKAFEIKHIPEPTKNVKFHVIELFQPFHSTINTRKPNGIAVRHHRQLKRMGYCVHPLYFDRTMEAIECMEEAIAKILAEEVPT